MSDTGDEEEVTFSLKVMINKEKTKVLFAESDGSFVDVLLSFLTLPLGRIVKILAKHYGDEAPSIGCLNTLYNSLSNLDSSHFWTEGAKKILLNPTSSFDIECRSLKLDISDNKPEYFRCKKCSGNRYWSRSIYYDKRRTCGTCGGTLEISEMEKLSLAARSGVFTLDKATFAVTDDLQIVPTAIGLLDTISILDIKGTDNAELMNATFGLSEIMNLLKTSMMSQTPLSDLLLNKTRKMNSVSAEIKSGTSEDQIEKEETPQPKKMTLKVALQKSTNRLLFAQGKEDFIEFLFSLLTIPLGGVECLLASKTSIKSIDNLHRSVTDLIDDEYFKSSDIKNSLIKPELPHGYISDKQILPLAEKTLPDTYKNISLFSCTNLPQGNGNFIKGPAGRTYQVSDDLTVVPFCISSILFSLNEQKIPLSDVKELEIEIGLEEALSILKASLTSNSALTNALLNPIFNKLPKQES